MIKHLFGALFYIVLKFLSSVLYFCIVCPVIPFIPWIAVRAQLHLGQFTLSMQRKGIQQVNSFGFAVASYFFKRQGKDHFRCDGWEVCRYLEELKIETKEIENGTEETLSV